MKERALLLGLLIALSAPAADAPPEIIDEAALEPQFKDFRARCDQVNKQALPVNEFVLYYQQQAQAKGTPRQQAIAAFFYGFVLQLGPPSKESKDAKREFQRAIDLEPGFVLAYAELANIAYGAGDRSEAERLLQRALQKSPTFVRAIVQLGQMAQQAGELRRAKALYEQSVGIKPTLHAFGGLVIVNTALFQRSYDEKEKEQLARAALAASDAAVTLEPDSAALRLAKAEVFWNLGRVKEAIDFLERLYAGGTLKPEVKVDLLKMLRGIHQSQGNVEGVKHALDRLLTCETLRPEERARIASRAKDLKEMGGNAFIKAGIEDAISNLRNPGLSVEGRLTELRRLQGFITSEAFAVEQLRPLVEQASRECFRVLVDGISGGTIAPRAGSTWT